MQRLTVPTPEQHARFALNNLTRYTYAEIVAAATEYDASVAAHEDVVQRAWAIVEANAPHGTHWVAWWTMLEEPYSTLHDAMGEDATYCGRAGRSSRESWPIRQWLAAAKANRAVVARIEKAIALCTGSRSGA